LAFYELEADNLRTIHANFDRCNRMPNHNPFPSLKAIGNCHRTVVVLRATNSSGDG